MGGTTLWDPEGTVVYSFARESNSKITVELDKIVLCIAKSRFVSNCYCGIKTLTCRLCLMQYDEQTALVAVVVEKEAVAVEKAT